jgi:hypothetical protein
LHGAARFVGGFDGLVEGCGPPGEEFPLDLLVLVEARFADFFARDGEFLEALRERVRVGAALWGGGGDGLQQTFVSE